jgi:hypothetical protein
MLDGERLLLADRCLAVFVDDTGHERFAKGHPVYGLGGCAVLGRDLEARITSPWREVRRLVRGSPHMPLHAHHFAKKANPAHMEAVAEFFRARHFFRFGAIMSEQTNFAAKLSRMRAMKGVLQERVEEIVQRTLCKEVNLIFESSNRADKLIQEAFQDFEVSRSSKRIPSECYFMPKAAAEPALEVADFVAHSIGRQARYNLKHSRIFLPDFCAVFHSVDPKLISYFEVTDVVPNPAAALQGEKK